MKVPNLQSRPSPLLWVATAAPAASRYLRPGGGTYRRPGGVATYKRP
jgi:hypothetical protein